MEGPCPGKFANATYAATGGDVFPINWALWVNHNTPPSPPGFVSFNFLSRGSNSTYSMEPIVDQPTNRFFTQNVILPKTSGPLTVQVVYNINGAKGPAQKYYQCLDLVLA
eukprot:CAMPEP_0201544398 /NCGR_PEP_ID=MMETSP0173_2-20130828/1008_1 /ASSEMBLY_ACC=CAM_ASM_000268 /TAXON_ID=218659 /ORGANISM="Vexillifera sp., Strain DIVA3 564/2" /LENGTH=109 /DNA_ID=CAMNT_0047952495 /DNA_START=125 /DNA_END=454 /DNA_ORIENTATION=-